MHSAQKLTEDSQEQVEGSLVAVRCADNRAAGFDLGIDQEWDERDCLRTIIEGYNNHLVHQAVMPTFTPVGPTRELIGCVERGLLPSKFSPATVSVDELHRVATMERSVLHQQFAGAVPYADEVWHKAKHARSPLTNRSGKVTTPTTIPPKMFPAANCRRSGNFKAS